MMKMNDGEQEQGSDGEYDEVCCHLLSLLQQCLLEELPGDVLNNAIGLLKGLKDSTAAEARQQMHTIAVVVQQNWWETITYQQQVPPGQRSRHHIHSMTYIRTPSIMSARDFAP